MHTVIAVDEESRQIALVLGQTRNDLLIEHGVRRYANGLELPWTFTRLQPERLAPGALDGTGRRDLVYAGAIGYLPVPGGRDWLRRQACPVVQLSDAPLDHPHQAWIAADDRAIGAMAAEHLVDRGYRHFACKVPEEEGVRARRNRAFVERLRRLGFACADLAVETADNPPKAEAELACRLATGPGPLAVFHHQDRAAIAFLEICARHGLRVPDDVAILGVDDVEACRVTTPPLSSVVLPWEHVGRLAAQYLHRLISGEDVGDTVRVPPLHVAHRASTAAPHAGDPLVRRALAIIGRDYAKPLRIVDLARGLGVDRSTLHRRCVRATGTSPGEHLQRARIAAAKDLLATTDLPIGEVMRKVGYPCRHHFNAIFRERTGTTPTGFRRSPQK